MTLPFLTADVPAFRATFRQRPEDFVVEEIPAYEPCGSGDHVFFAIEKTGLTTPDAVRATARALGVGPRAIGYAGMKDARGITTQVFSLEHADPKRIAALELGRMRVLWSARHTNKLRVGHLHGNRFALKLRDFDPAQVRDLRTGLDALAARGVPNYFGQQRFGARGDTWQIGRALLARDLPEAVALIAGRPGPRDHGKVRAARQRFDDGDFEGAARTWPGGFRDCVRLCRGMARSGGDERKALRALDRSVQRFYTSAYQSHLFNELLSLRVAELDTVLEGDLAWRHGRGSVFRVVDLDEERERAARFEISATGPLFGRRMTEPEGRPQELEQEVLQRAEVDKELLTRNGPLQWKGARRPLRFQPADLDLRVGEDDSGPFVELRFRLPAGCYATSVLRELLKPESGDEPLPDDPEG